jgi:hypothetical protein
MARQQAECGGASWELSPMQIGRRFPETQPFFVNGKYRPLGAGLMHRKLIRFVAHTPRPENSYVIAELRPARRPMRKVSSECLVNRTFFDNLSGSAALRFPAHLSLRLAASNCFTMSPCSTTGTGPVFVIMLARRLRSTGRGRRGRGRPTFPERTWRRVRPCSPRSRPPERTTRALGRVDIDDGGF